MESEQDAPNSLRYDSAPRLRRMSSIFKRFMRKEDGTVNSNRNIIVPQWKPSLPKEVEDTDLPAGNKFISWIRNSSDISWSGSKDWRRGSGSSRSSYSSVFSKGRFSYGSTTLTTSTSARRSSGMSYTGRFGRSGTFSAQSKTPIVNEKALCESIKSGKGPRKDPEFEDCQFVRCSCSDLICPHTSMSPPQPLGLAKCNSLPGESEPLMDRPFTVPRTSPDFYGELRPRARTLPGSIEERHRQSHLQVMPAMHESLRDTSSCVTSSSRSTHVTEYDSTTASEYEDDLSEETQLTPLTGLLVEKLLRLFYHCDGTPSPGNHTCNGSSGNSSPRNSPGGQGGEATSAHGHRLPHRRAMGSQGNESHDSGGEEEDEDRPAKRMRNMPKDATSQPLPLLACPFCKWQPLTYQHCHKYILKDISRVKQHLRRNHRRPPYCPKCWQTFTSEESRDLHIRTDSCLSRKAIPLQGITAAQQEQLERRVDKKLSKADQWFSMYSILFPDCPRPSSPYVEGDLSAELLSFQRFVGAEGLPIVEQTAREHIPPNLFPQQEQLVEFSQTLFQHAIPRILQHYESTRPNANIASSDSGYGGSSTRSGGGGAGSGGGRVSREIERPVLRPQGQRSIFPMHTNETLFPESFLFDANTDPNTGHGTFPAFSPNIPTNEPLADFDMGDMNNFHY